jgi:hypothetical protein
MIGRAFMKALNAEPVEDVLLFGAGGGGGGGGRLPATLAPDQDVVHTHLMVVGLLIGAALVFLAGWGFGEYRSQGRSY